MSARNLVVDGSTTDDPKTSVYDSDPEIGKYPPFVVFDIDAQEVISGRFQTHQEAQAMLRALGGGYSVTSEAWIAWTGGSMPADFGTVSDLEQHLVYALLTAQLAGYRAFWGAEPSDDVKRVYWNRARYDAHATVRAGCASKEVPR